LINIEALNIASKNWLNQKPFPHFIVDGFFENKIAEDLENEFPSFNDNSWHEYGNAIEIKKVCNNWNIFPSQTYKAFSYLNSIEFVTTLSKLLFGESILSSDPGLNGGGWHIHKRGGKLNQHLDYSLHPKLKLQRKLNIIIYVSSEWDKEWGGNFGLWSNESKDHPGKLQKEIEPKFNRAVIFDTTMNSWHGLTSPLTCPEDRYRKSLAAYYLCNPPINVDTRGKALFAPTEMQSKNKEVLDLIRKRSSIESAQSVYSKKTDILK